MKGVINEEYTFTFTNFDYFTKYMDKYKFI